MWSFTWQNKEKEDEDEDEEEEEEEDRKKKTQTLTTLNPHVARHPGVFLSFFLSVGWDDDPSQLLQSRRSQESWIDHMLQKLLSSAWSKSFKSIKSILRKQMHSSSSSQTRETYVLWICISSLCTGPLWFFFFFPGETSPKREIKYQKFGNESVVLRFSISRSEKINK
jgi:hypothetical protein